MGTSSDNSSTASPRSKSASERSHKSAPTKRSKTFTGCVTCRARSLKCDEQKPGCQRCSNGGLQCGGYKSFGLVWPGEKKPGDTHRRLLLDRNLGEAKLLDYQGVDDALQAFESYGSDDLRVGLFSVFPVSQEKRKLSRARRGKERVGASRSVLGSEKPTTSEGLRQQNILPFKTRRGSRSAQQAQFRTPRHKTASPSLSPQPTDFLSRSIPARQERRSLHYWVNYLSGLVTPTPRPDNAFKDIVTPLAVMAIGREDQLPAHAALLHSLEAMAAFSLSGTVRSPEIEHDFGDWQALKSLRYLSRNLRPSELDAQKAILATIIAHIMIPCFSTGKPEWRIHVRGGAKWVKSIDRSAWRKDQAAVTLYQVFRCLESLCSVHRATPLEREDENYDLDLLSPGTADKPLEFGAIELQRSLYHDETGWVMDGILGITKPIVEVISRINQWLFFGVVPPEEHLEQLELKIFRNDPATMSFGCPNDMAERLAKHNACAFYFASHIYLASSLRKLPPHRVHHLVERGLHEFEQIELLEQKLNFNVSGMLWPLCITACEAEDPALRDRFRRYFDRHTRRSCHGLRSMIDVIVTVWERRDATGKLGYVAWHEVMSEKGLDMPIT